MKRLGCLSYVCIYLNTVFFSYCSDIKALTQVSFLLPSEKYEYSKAMEGYFIEIKDWFLNISWNNLEKISCEEFVSRIQKDLKERTKLSTVPVFDVIVLNYKWLYNINNNKTMTITPNDTKILLQFSEKGNDGYIQLRDLWKIRFEKQKKLKEEEVKEKGNEWEENKEQDKNDDIGKVGCKNGSCKVKKKTKSLIRKRNVVVSDNKTL